MSVFFITGAATAGVFGRLGDMFGKRRILLVQMALFSLGALVCGLSSSLPLLIAGRAVMGVSVGLFALSFSVLRDEMPARRVPTTIAYVGGTGAVAAALGQGTGGLVTDHLGYHWIFWIGVIGGLGPSPLSGSSCRSRGRRRRDAWTSCGALLLDAGLAIPLAAISLTPTWGWLDARTLGLIAAGVGVLVAFVLLRAAARDPLLDLDTLGCRASAART